MTDYLAKARDGHDIARGGWGPTDLHELTASIALAEDQRRIADALERIANAAETPKQHPTPAESVWPNRGLVIIGAIVTVGLIILFVAAFINDIS